MRTEDERLPYWGHTNNARSLRGLWLWENTCEPATEIPRHAHEVATLSLLLCGCATERYGSRTVERTAGTAFWRGCTQEHSFHVGAERTQCINVAFEPSWLERIEGLRVEELESMDACAAPVVWTSARILEEMWSWSAGSALAVEGMVLQILAMIQRSHATRIDPLQPAWISRIEEILRSELDRQPTIAELAERVNVDPIHLTRTWRRFRHCTLGDFANRVRIERATELIANETESLQEIARRVGFTHPTRFSRVFREVTGLTPSAFRLVFNCASENEQPL